MIESFRTSKMEESVIALDKAYNKVMARADVRLPGPIRIRTNLLQDIRPFYLRSNEAFDSQVDRWDEENGTLLNYRNFNKAEKRYPHDALFICEAPLSIDELELLTRDTQKICVIYRPPTWRRHEEAAFIKYPPSTQCKRLVQAVLGAGPTKEYAEMAQALGIPTAGTYAITDDDLMTALGIPKKEMSVTRKRALVSMGARRFSLVYPLIPRIEPDDKNLHDLYRYIVDTLPEKGKFKLAKDNVLSNAARFWKVALRALVRSGSVERKPAIGFYFMGDIAPDYDRIQAAHLAGKARLARLIEYVDALPDFLSRLPSRPSRARGSRESASTG